MSVHPASLSRGPSGALIHLDWILEGSCPPINQNPLFIQMLICCLKFLRSQEGGLRPFLITFCFPVLPRGQKGQAQTKQQTTRERNVGPDHINRRKDLHFERPCWIAGWQVHTQNSTKPKFIKEKRNVNFPSHAPKRIKTLSQLCSGPRFPKASLA